MKDNKLNLIMLTSIICLLLSQNVYAQSQWIKRGSDSTKYEMGTDKNTSYNGQPVHTIKSNEIDIKGFGTYMQKIIPGKYLGKRIKMTGNVKTKDVSDGAGLWLRVDQAVPHKMLAFDNMDDRPIKGSSDWGKYEIVLDVPQNASAIAFGALLSGTGQMWFSDLIIEVVPDTTPTTGNKE